MIEDRTHSFGSAKISGFRRCPASWNPARRGSMIKSGEPIPLENEGWRHKVAATRAQRLEKAGLAPGQLPAEVFVGAGSGDAASRGAVDQPDLHQVRLVHLFDGVFFLAERRR